jgi:hypothetical protein
MEETGGKNAVAGIKKRARRCEDPHAAPSHPTLKKALRVPREKPDRAHSGEIQQASLDAPEDLFARRTGSVLTGVNAWGLADGWGQLHRQKEVLQGVNNAEINIVHAGNQEKLMSGSPVRCECGEAGALP